MAKILFRSTRKSLIVAAYLILRSALAFISPTSSTERMLFSYVSPPIHQVPKVYDARELQDFHRISFASKRDILYPCFWLPTRSTRNESTKIGCLSLRYPNVSGMTIRDTKIIVGLYIFFLRPNFRETRICKTWSSLYSSFYQNRFLKEHMTHSMLVSIEISRKYSSALFHPDTLNAREKDPMTFLAQCSFKISCHDYYMFISL